MNPLQFRTEVLRSYGADDSDIEPLLHYNQNVFEHDPFNGSLKAKEYGIAEFAPEPHIQDWQHYVQDAVTNGTYAALKSRLVQLRFPIQAGISETESYRDATRKGILSDDLATEPGLMLNAADRLELQIYPTLAGPIPVIIAGCRRDFVSLVQALTRRNEPNPIPESMGACLISGYNNWDRVNQYRQQWMTQHYLNGHSNGDRESAWLDEFKRLIPQKERYQDRFILLSLEPYSHVPAAELELTDLEWERYSLTIRLEHECTHYCTKRFFNAMSNRMLDELIADYMGIVAAFGQYHARWFLRFMGLESFPRYRQGGRLENYRNTLSESAFRILQHLVKQAAENLERFDQTYFPVQSSQSGRSNRHKRAVLFALTRLTLEEFAADSGSSLIQAAVDQEMQWQHAC